MVSTWRRIDAEMVQKARRTISLTRETDHWITEQAKKQGISKNDVIQMLINKAMKREAEAAASQTDESGRDLPQLLQ